MAHFAAFYSDPHFGHKNIIKFADRPFNDVRHMERELIKRYNNVVGKNDTVLWLGDCFWSMSGYKMIDILDKMNGSKVLVIGNHDKSASYMASLGFLCVTTELVLEIAGTTVRASHYPYTPKSPKDENPYDTRYIDRRPKRHKGEVLIHGHTHSHEKVNGRAIHVGVDAWDQGPAPLTAVENLILRHY